MASHMDYDEFGVDAPQPVDAGSVEKGAFDQLGAGEGAVSASRRQVEDTHMEQHAASRRTIAVMVVAALAAIALIVVWVVRVLDAPARNAPEEPVQAEQAEVAADGAIAYRGETYALVESVDGYALAQTPAGEGGQPVLLGDLAGEPVSLVLFDATLIMPENLSDGTWDVLAYTIGSGWSQIMDQDGNAYGGSGTVEKATLDGSELLLTIDGAETRVPLTW